MNAAFATGYSDDAVDSEAVVRVFVEEEILTPFRGRPGPRRLAQAFVFYQCFSNCWPFFILASISGSSDQAAREYPK